MKLRTKLGFFLMTVLAGSLGLFAWGVDHFIRQQFKDQQSQQAQTLVSQFRREFARRGDEVVYAVQGIAEAEGTLRMAIDLSRPQADPSLYVHDAQGIANSRQLDFFEIVADDGMLISSAQWPGRIGFKNDWVTQANDWNQQGAFLSRVELPDKIELGLLCVRAVSVGQKKLYLIGGRRLDADFLQALVIPAGMRVVFYRNLEAAFVPDALLDPTGPIPAPERFAALIGSMQKQPRTGEYDIPEIKGVAGPERFTSLPLNGRSNELLALVLVGGEQDTVAKTSNYIRNAALIVGAAALLLALIFSWVISSSVSSPLERLEKAARQLAAGDWKARTEVRTRGEAGRAARAFDEMAAQLNAKREKLLQAERVAAWRELARNFALELKVPLFSLKLTTENLLRARQKTPDRFDLVFGESMHILAGDLENLEEIIARFSDFAKLRQPALRAVNVNEVLRAVIKSFETAFQSRGRPPVKPELRLDENAAKILADPELLYKGFENLIAHSLNAMPMGGTLTVQSAQKDGIVRVEISDTGSGVEGLNQGNSPAAVLPPAAKAEGAGLSFATMQTVVSEHGGHMSVESVPGGGTIFHIEFSIAPASGRAPQPEPVSTQLKRETEARPKQSESVAMKPKPSFARIMDI